MNPKKLSTDRGDNIGQLLITVLTMGTMVIAIMPIV